MNTFSRAFTALLLCVMLFTLTLWRNDAFPDLSGFTAFIRDTADTFSGFGQGTAQRPPSDGKADFPLYPLSEELNPELEMAICNAFIGHKTGLDLSAFRLSEETLKDVITEIRFNHPEFFYVDKEFKYLTASAGGYVTELKPSYLWDAAQTATLMAEYRAMVDAIVASIPDGTDFDKLLYLHDYFIQNYCYDDTLTIRDAYTFFKQKAGVCQAYMLALIAVTQEIGIESIPVTSNKMNHAWNLVLLDGEWYHMDITWDDAVSYPSYISYDYFLQSDAGLIAIDGGDIEYTDLLQIVAHALLCGSIGR